MQPATAAGNPTPENWKRVNGLMGGFGSASIRALRMRLVDVPMSEHMPPSSDANERGMRRTLTDRLDRAAHCSQTPMSIATIGVLLRKAESTTTGNVSRSSALTWFFGVPRMGRSTASMALVSSRALATTRRAPIASTEVEL